MLEEGIEVIVRLLGDGPAHFDGRYYQLNGANPRPKPMQRPRIPLLIGTTGAGRMLRVVARYADEWDAPGITSPSAIPRQARAPGDILPRDQPRSLRDPSLRLNGLPDRPRCGGTAPSWGSDAAAYPEPGSPRPGAVPEVLRADGWLVGTPDQIIVQLQALADEGVERVIFQHNDPTDFEALELLARDVMPAVAT